MNDEIYQSALALLARRPYFSGELKAALRKQFPSSDNEERDLIIGKLCDLQLLDDRKYAAEYVRFYMRSKPQGVFSIRQKFVQKGVADEIIDSALRDYIPAELQVAAELAKKKLSLLPGIEPQKKKAKVIRFLQGRGFPFSVALEAFNNAAGAEDERH